MGHLFVRGVVFIFFLLSIFVIVNFSSQEVFAYVLDCNNGDYISGDCSGTYKTPVDCPPYLTGAECCQYLKTAQGFTGTIGCSNACRVPASGEICSTESSGSCLNSSCLGTSVFCCNYSSPTPTPSPCTSGIVCSGTCTSSQSNTCSNNGTWSGGCVYTTGSPGCTQAPAPNLCSVNKCTSGYSCDGITCNLVPCSSFSSTSCSNCLYNSAGATCGWNSSTSSCASGSASCPVGSSSWYWYDCSTNQCSGTTPNCNSGISCSGGCTAPDNTCATNNGAQTGCVYTTYSGGGSCTSVVAPNQPCTTDTCSVGNTCDSYGACVPNSCPAMTCRYTESVPTGTCSSGQQWVKGTGCSGDNCSGCTYVNPTCSTKDCYVPGATPTSTPTSSPTTTPPITTPTPSSDQPCGSCSTGCGGDSSKSHCYGVDAGGGLVDMGCLSKNVCFQAGDGICKWDPTSCKDPAPPLTGDSPPFFTVNLYACDAGEFDPDHNGNGYDDTYSCAPTGTEINVEPGHVVDFQLKGWNYSTNPTRMVPDYDMWGLFNQAQPGTKSLGEVRDWNMGPSEGSSWRWNCAPGDDWANDHQPTDVCKRVNQCHTSWSFSTGACGITWKEYTNVDGTCRNAVRAGEEGLPYGWSDQINYIVRIDPTKAPKGTKITTRGLFHKIAYIGPSGYLPVGYEAKLFQERVPNNQIGLVKSFTTGSEWWDTLSNNWGSGFGPAYSTCNSDENLAFFSNWVTINVKTTDPWLKVVGGNVHSNQ